MDCLIYRYNSIYERSVIDAFTDLGLNCIEELSGIAARGEKKTRVEAVSSHIISHISQNNPLLFVFSINYFPDISELCKRLGTIYVCWSVDSPVMELFSETIKNKTNRIFLFDRAQYLRFAHYNPECIFYLPLATNLPRWDKEIASISSDDIKKYSSDITLVGSLYNEKNPMADLKPDEYTLGFAKGLIASQLPLYGSFILEDALPDDIADKIVPFEPVDPVSGFVEPVKKYMAACDYLASQLAVDERKLTLNRLSEEFNVSLYTQSDSSEVPNVHNMGPANTLTEMPKIFNLSKINLNITLRSIISGIPLRVFDVCGCGGFLISNYQEELFDYFEPGVDIEVYGSLDELCDKCRYYLSHDDAREKIARNGYNRVQSSHTINIRIAEMLSMILN